MKTLIHWSDPSRVVHALVARIGVVDLDKDIIAPGSIVSGSPLVLSRWQHNSMVKPEKTPAGVGELFVVNKEVHAFMKCIETPAGDEALTFLRESIAFAQWSFGFIKLRVRQSSEDERKRGAERVLLQLDTFEASPVIRGAGGNATGTISVGEKADQERQDFATRAAREAADQATLRRIADDLIQRELAEIAANVRRMA
jgi:hypothetical protein